MFSVRNLLATFRSVFAERIMIAEVERFGLNWSDVATIKEQDVGSVNGRADGSA